jgi:hypothetical protein
VEDLSLVKRMRKEARMEDLGRVRKMSLQTKVRS